MARRNSRGREGPNNYVADQNLGPIEALRSSWRDGTGRRGPIVLVAIVSCALLGASMMCCGLGALVAYPFVYIAAAIVYLRMSGATGRAGAEAQRPRVRRALASRLDSSAGDMDTPPLTRNDARNTRVRRCIAAAPRISTRAAPLSSRWKI